MSTKYGETSIVQLPEIGNNKESGMPELHELHRCARKGDRVAYKVASAEAGSKW